ncbi:MAG TPA: hypothetical protein VFC55_08455, partial [Desulfobaccales bacterium]|nr:hypothetical protein [Desulfobaccales bacterium]
LIEALYNQGQDLGRFYQDLILYARHLLVAGLHPEARHLAAVADTEWDALIALARRTPAVHLHNLLSVLLQGEEDLKRAPQPRLALEVLLLRVIHLEPVLPLNEWLARLDTLEKRLETGPWVASPSAGAGEPQPRASVPAAGEPAASPAATPPGVPMDAGLNDQWQAFLQFVQEKENGPLFGKLAQCRLVGRSDNCLKIAMGRPWNANGARHEARLQELARTFFGPETTLEFEVDGPKTPKKSPAAAKKPLDMQKLQQQALEIFGGEWISGTPGKEEPE